MATKSLSFEAVLDLCIQLSEADRYRLVTILAPNILRVRLQAWCDGYDGPATKPDPFSSPHLWNVPYQFFRGAQTERTVLQCVNSKNPQLLAAPGVDDL